MQVQTYNILQNRPDLLHVIRYEPHWYRLLTRDPENLSDLEKRAKYFHGKTLSQKLESATQKADMFNMLLSMAALTDD